jgi:hypothetical protein
MPLRFRGIFQQFWYHKYELLSIFFEKECSFRNNFNQLFSSRQSASEELTDWTQPIRRPITG